MNIGLLANPPHFVTQPATGYGNAPWQASPAGPTLFEPEVLD